MEDSVEFGLTRDYAHMVNVMRLPKTNQGCSDSTEILPHCCETGYSQNGTLIVGNEKLSRYYRLP